MSTDGDGVARRLTPESCRRRATAPPTAPASGCRAPRGVAGLGKLAGVEERPNNLDLVGGEGLVEELEEPLQQRILRVTVALFL